MTRYDPKEIEKRWQDTWRKKKTFAASPKSKKPSWYTLVEFPYPSGAGMHVGHVRSYTALDVVSRKRRMEGFNVLYPMGWDAFGLPTENYAIKTGIAPQVATKKNTDSFRKQLQSLGYSFDWAREVNTTDPNYYKWTQWIFQQFFKKGLAYKAKMAINWCPKDKIGLANEEVVNGKCERCGTAVEQRQKEQWMLKITAYADKLLEGLKDLEYLPEIKAQQGNWIGRSEGAEIEFPIVGSENKIKVFTTRPDTILGATFLVVAPEHKALAHALENPAALLKNKDEVRAYIAAANKKSDLERQADSKDPSTGSGQGKTGVELKGLRVINPATKEEIPVWTADYVMATYGTGAIMAVPAHDERDRAFAEKFKLPIVDKPFVSFEEALRLTGGKKSVKYKLRDWVFSRQRYWGEPIPLIRCEGACSKRPKVLLVHGLHGSSKENWFPWFKESLEARGYDVVIPDLPSAAQVGLAGWLTALKKSVKKGERLAAVVAHSLGGPAACQFILANNLSVGRLILVAPTGASQGPENWEKLKVVGGAGPVEIQTIKDFNRANKGLAKLSKRVGSSVLYLSDNDPYIPLSVRDDYAALAGDVREFASKGHFNKRSGMTEFPEILDEFPPTRNNGWICVPEKDLPVKLPRVAKYEPTDTGESPLSLMPKWVNVKCPQCKGPAKRETDTMPNWAGSSWYFLAYLMDKNAFKGKVNEATWKKQMAHFKQFMPVNWYNGGMEHVTLHLLYSRFWNQFLFDEGLVPASEPYKKRTAHGMILAADGKKMSKSLGNVVNPDDLVKEFGADALRLYELFIGPFDQAVQWDPRGILGCSRFLERVWRIGQEIVNSKQQTVNSGEEIERLLNKTIKKVGEHIETANFNTAVSAMMIFVNVLEKGDANKNLSFENWKKFLIILSPFAPHLAEQLWSLAKGKGMACDQSWPKVDESLLVETTCTLVVQFNGRVRGTISVARDITEGQAIEEIRKQPELVKWLTGEIAKIIFVPNRLINLIIKA